MSNQTKSKSQGPSKLQQLNIKESPTLILDKNLMNLVNFLHNQNDKDEWSGILFYDVEGSIQDIKNLIFRAKHFMLRDIGTGASTSYEYDEEVLNYFNEVPEALDMKMGHLHTHHNMNNYFSSTDMSELNDNCRNHNYYLSLIVSYDCDYSAKLAIYGKIESQTVTIKGDNGEPIKKNIPGNEVMYIADCNIKFELDSYNIKTCKRLLKEKKEKAKAKAKTTYGNYGNTNYGYGHYTGAGYQNKQYPKPYKPKNQINLFRDNILVEDALVSLFLLSTEGADLKGVTLDHAIIRLDETFNDAEKDAYTDELYEEIFNIVDFYFGSNEVEDITEFCDQAIPILDSETSEKVQELDMFDALREFLIFNSSEAEEYLTGETI